MVVQLASGERIAVPRLAWAGRRAAGRCSSTACRGRRGPGCRSRDGSRAGTPSWRRTCAGTAPPTRRARATTSSRSRSTCSRSSPRRAGATAVGGPAVVVAGHGLGAIVAVEMARLEPASVAGLVLVDGGWEEIGETTRLSAPELVAAMADPPEVMASMEAYLADRRDFDPASWDADQERAARAAVVERHAGHVSPVVACLGHAPARRDALRLPARSTRSAGCRMPGDRPRRRDRAPPTTRSAASDSSRSRTSSDARRGGRLATRCACVSSMAPGTSSCATDPTRSPPRSPSSPPTAPWRGGASERYHVTHRGP